MTNNESPAVTIKRQTKETKVELSLKFSEEPEQKISTGIGFFDHMLNCLAFHAGWDLQLKATGDLEVDDHHIVEDCAIVLGQALDELMKERRGINRFGYAYAPLDESLSRAVIDLVSRPCSTVELGLTREKVGELACENVSHFFTTLATNARFTLHLDLLRGNNDHHRIESAFKAFALAIKQALQKKDVNSVGSTKGVL